jgi:hypothetical protein
MSAQAQEVPVYSLEENQGWWKALGNERRDAIYASTLHRFPWLENHMQFSQTTLQSENFANTAAFKLMMDVLGR